MARGQRLDTVVLELIEQSARNLKTRPLNLGGVSGANGGTGTVPGGFIGKLPQTKVTYDTTEASSLDTPASGQSLIDNLNHIRYRLNVIESGGSITVVDDETIQTYNDIDTIHFSGAIVINDLGAGDIQVVVATSGGSSSPLTVEEQDGSPSVANVDTIIFSGAVVTDLGGGDVLVQIASSGGGGAALTVEESDGSPSVTTVDTIVFSGIAVSDLGSGDALVYPEEGTGSIYFLTTVVADVATYLYANKIKSNSFVTRNTAAVTTTDQVLDSFITPVGFPKVYRLGQGTYRVFLRSQQTSTAGKKDLRIKLRIYKRNTSGTETLLMESLESDNILSGYIDRVFVLRGGPFVVDDEDRIVVKIIGNAYSAGTDPLLTFTTGDPSGYSVLELCSSTEDSFISDITYRTNTITSSNLPAIEQSIYRLTIGGMTANRNFILPAPSAAGKTIELFVADGDDTYALLIIGDTGVTINEGGAATEWSRLFIAGEKLKLVSSSTTNWDVLVDGRIPCVGLAERQAVQAIGTASTVKVLLDTAVTNIGNIVDVTTNDRINIRRAGIYVVSGQTSIEALDDTEYVIVSIFVDGASISSLRGYDAGDANVLMIAASPTKGITFTAGQYIELYVRHVEGATQNTGTGGSTPFLYAQEVL